MEKEAKKLKKASENHPKVAPKTDSSKIYELGYIILPSRAEKIAEEVEAISAMISKNGGEMISSENPVLIDLEYQMVKVIHAHREKCNEGYFGWMKFEIETENIAEVKKFLDNSEAILRYLLIKTVRENTLLNGKMNLGNAEEKKRKPKFDDEEGVDIVAPEVVAPINEEELDKSIDDLVIA